MIFLTIVDRQPDLTVAQALTTYIDLDLPPANLSEFLPGIDRKSLSICRNGFQDIGELRDRNSAGFGMYEIVSAHAVPSLFCSLRQAGSSHAPPSPEILTPRLSDNTGRGVVGEIVEPVHSESMKVLWQLFTRTSTLSEEEIYSIFEVHRIYIWIILRNENFIWLYDHFVVHCQTTSK